MPANTVIMWFRQDLRLSDNPALLKAIQQGRVLPVFILDQNCHWPLGEASRWWLHHSLSALNESLLGNLWVLQGDAAKLLPQFANEQGASHVFWNRCYEPSIIHRDSLIKEQLTADGLTASSLNGSLIWEPWENLKQDGTAYKIFTPFYKYAIANHPPAAPSHEDTSTFDTVKCLQDKNRFDKLNLLPAINWHKQISATWQPGEKGARQRLQNFIHNGLGDYRDGRDYPDKRSVSMLSPHLHFGEISPREAASMVKQAGDIDSNEEQATHFVRELAWREFSYYSLYHFPHICQQNMKAQFDRFVLQRPWQSRHDRVHAPECKRNKPPPKRSFPESPC